MTNYRLAVEVAEAILDVVNSDDRDDAAEFSYDPQGTLAAILTERLKPLVEAGMDIYNLHGRHDHETCLPIECKWGKLRSELRKAVGP